MHPQRVTWWNNENTQSLATISRSDGIQLIPIGGGTRPQRPRRQRVDQDVKEMLALAMGSFLCGATFSWLIGVLS